MTFGSDIIRRALKEKVGVDALPGNISLGDRQYRVCFTISSDMVEKWANSFGLSGVNTKDGDMTYVPTSQVQEGRAPSSEKTTVRGNKRVTSIIIDDSNEGQVILDACCDLPNGEGNTSVNVTFYYKKVTLSHGEEGKLNLSFFAVSENDTDIEISLTKDMVEKIQENMFQWLIKGSL